MSITKNKLSKIPQEPGVYIFKDIDESIIDANTVSIHIRRTDYEQYDNQPWYPLPIDYYKECIKEFNKDTKYTLFSDDIEWCKENFKNYNCTFIEERPHDKTETVTVNESLREANSRKFSSNSKKFPSNSRFLTANSEKFSLQTQVF